MSQIVLQVIDQFSGPLTAYGQQMQAATVASEELAAGLATADGATAALSQGLTTYNVESGMALQGTEGLAAAMAAFDAEAAAATAATASLSESEMTMAAESAIATENLDLMGMASTVASSAMMALAGAGIAVAAAIGASKAAYDNTIGAASALGAEVRKLQFETGASAEAASKLAYAANITGVGVDALSRGINIATRALATHKSLGIEPNIDGLAKLSDMYLQIQDPIQRNAFLLHEFGRSGADLAPLMALGSAGIKGLGDQAVATGNVLDQQSVTQLHNYDMQLKQLTLDAKGFGVALGVDLLPAATRVVDGGLNLVHTLDMIKTAQQDGIITTNNAIAITLGLADHTLKLSDVYYNLAPQIQGYNDKQAASIGLAERLAQQHDALTASTEAAAGAFRHMADNTQAMVDKYPALDKGARALDDAARKAGDAMQLQIDKGIASAAMSNVIDKAQKNYETTVDSSQKEIDKLTKSIADMTAANGQSYTVVSKGKISQEDYTVAVDRANLAMAKYQDALAGTIDKHGKLHMKTDLTIEGLRIAAVAAQNSVDDLTGHVETSTTATANYTTALADAKAKLADLQQKEQDAQDQISKTTGQFILQQLALDMKLAPAMELQMAKALGLVNQREYDLAQTVLGATKLFDLNKNGMIDSGTEADALANYLAGLQTQFSSTATVLPPFTSHVGEAADKLAYAKDQALAFVRAEDSIHDKMITITTNFMETHNSSWGPNNNPPAGGGPPGANGGPGGQGNGPPAGSGSNINGGPGGSNGTSVSSNGPSVGGGVTVNFHGPITVGPGTTKESAAAFGAALAQGLRNQSLAGAQYMGQ